MLLLIENMEVPEVIEEWIQIHRMLLLIKNNALPNRRAGNIQIHRMLLLILISRSGDIISYYSNTSYVAINLCSIGTSPL